MNAAPHHTPGTPADHAVTSEEPGCTCGGMAACLQCQDRDAATADHDPAGLSEGEREALAELAVLYGTFTIGRWAEVMASDDEPADDWQEQAAREAVDLFAPGAARMLARIVAERVRAVEVERDDLRARLGRVEALAAEMESYDYPLSAKYYAGRLRAALGDRGAEGADAGAEGAVEGAQDSPRVDVPGSGFCARYEPCGSCHRCSDSPTDDYTRGWQDGLEELRKRMEDA